MQYGWMQPMKKAYLNTDFMKKYWWKMFDDIIRLSDFGGKKITTEKNPFEHSGSLH